jgi:hypothetical protein
MAIPPNQLRVYDPRPGPKGAPATVFRTFVVYGKSGRGLGKPYAEVRLACEEGGKPVPGELILAAEEPGGRLRWAILFEQVRRTPAGRTDQLVVGAEGMDEPQMILLRIIPEDLSEPLITYPTSTDTVCADYFIAYGGHASTGLDVTGDLQVGGSANGTITEIRQTPRWVLEITGVTVSAASLATLTVSVAATASSPRTFTIDNCT